MRVFVDGRVAFRCTDGHGSAVAHWMGDRLPAPGTDTFVELTLPGPLTEWGPALPPAVSGPEIGRRISFGPARLEVYPYGL
ncbi:hypothetical protein ACR3S4_18690 [Streptomyces sp. CH8.1]|uniref:hypothetical protein n=1 Tax=Streptomyces sp. CH8.1 TaxID=3439546 RepID=UPI003DA0CF17